MIPNLTILDGKYYLHYTQEEWHNYRFNNVFQKGDKIMSHTDTTKDFNNCYVCEQGTLGQFCSKKCEQDYYLVMHNIEPTIEKDQSEEDK